MRSPVRAGEWKTDKLYYERWYSSRDWTFYSHLLGQIVVHSCPGPILDLGAGTGLLVECATRWGLDCQGLDGSHDAVAIGLQRFPALRISQHHLSKPLPLPNGSVQTVLLNQVIEHLEPEVAKHTLSECFRVLRTRGLVFVLSPSRFNRYERKTDPTHINMYAPSELRELIHNTGFVDIASMDAPIDFRGKGGIVPRAAMWFLFRATNWDFLSSTANCRAYKP
ncbi:MAG: class I SAM-dependent methyltransferase [Xanthobacteraceae bacterium]